MLELVENDLSWLFFRLRDDRVGRVLRLMIVLILFFFKLRFVSCDRVVFLKLIFLI